MMTESNSARLDRLKMATRFNAAVGSYEAVSALQKHVGNELLDRLELINIQPLFVLDLGSGPGHLAEQLATRYLKARIMQLDIAEKMLGAARKRMNKSLSRQYHVCADAESLPFATKTIDMVFSNLMLQWAYPPDQLLQQLVRALKPGGLLIFSTFGPDTLYELRDSWSDADDYPHVHAFVEMHDLGDALIRAGFIDPVIEVDYVTLTYDKVSHLMRDLKALGAVNVSTDRRKTLTGKRRFRQMEQTYEKRRHSGKLPATYEVIYGHAWIPAGDKPDRQPPSTIFKISLDSIKQALKKFS
jgi:malonyl-CoA O-methyltransferase